MSDAVEVLDPQRLKPKRKSKKPKPWNSDVQNAVQKSKWNYRIWKDTGRPGSSHPASIARRKSARAVRSALRKFQALKRDDLYKHINEAHGQDNKTFHLLITRQRSAPKQQTEIIKVDGKEITDPNEQCKAWRDHFASLANPQENAAYSLDLLDRSEQDLLLIDSCLDLATPSSYINQDVIKKAIQSLNTGKAMDNHHISAEHIKYAGDAVLPHITTIVQDIYKTKHVPQHMKEGRKIPIPKKGKDPTVRGNARGITITSVLGKVLETSLLLSTPIPSKQHSLQVGFTKDRSPGLGTLCVTEGISEATFRKKHLYIVSLDAKCAFDVVSHPILIRKVFLDSPHMDAVAIIRDLYQNALENVIWRGHYSEQYPVLQGVRQGGVLSTHLYKCYIDGLLQKIRHMGIGLYVGTNHLSISACADDVIMMAETEEEIQQLVDTAYEYAQAHRYTLHPEKSQILSCNTSPPEEVLMGETPLPTSKKLIHLGIERNLDKPSTAMAECVDSRIKLGRRTTYSLMSVGIYSGSGLNPSASLKILDTYVIPRVIYGLDAVLLKPKDVQALDVFHRDLLRDLQGLPRNTAKVAIYLLAGAIPLEAELHARSLTLAGSVARLDLSNPLRALAERQMALGNANSWFTHVLSLAEKYDLPLEAYLQEPWNKSHWKASVRDAVNSYWNRNLIKEASAKTSLKYICPNLIGDGKTHPVWTRSSNNPRSIRAAAVRAKMLTGTFPIQTNLKRNRQHESAICRLCQQADEDTTHLILHCPALEDIRKSGLKRLRDLFLEMQWVIPPEPHKWCRIILNGDPDLATCRPPQSKFTCSHRCSCSCSHSGRERKSLRELELESRVFSKGQQKLARIANDLCLKLDNKRSELLALLVQGDPG